MPKLTGIVKLKLSGALIRSLDGAELDIGGYERETQKGFKVYGYTEKVAESKVTCTIAHAADTDLIALRNYVDGTITFECDSGVTYLVANAFASKPPTLTGGKGEVKLEFMGDPAEQQ